MATVSPDPFQELRSFPHEGYAILSLSIFSGLATGRMIQVLVGVVNQPVAAHYWFAVLEFFITMVMALSANWVAMNRAAVMVECRLSQIRTAIGERLCDAQLVDMERQEHAAYLYPMVNVALIPNGLVKGLKGLQALVTMLFALFFVFWLSPAAGLLLLLIVLLTTFVYRHMSRRLRRLMHGTAREETQLLGYIKQFLDGFQEVKSNPALSEALVRGTMLSSLRRIRLLRARIGYDEVTLTNLITQGFFILLGACVFPLSFSMDKQTLAMVVAVILFLWKPIWIVIDVVPFVIKGYAAWQRLQQLVDHLPLPASQPCPRGGRPYLLPTFKSLQIDHVSFTYYDRDGAILYRFGPVTLTLFQHETLFIIGDNGCGKSTLIKLLTGLYQPSAGRFLLNGRPVAMHDYQPLFAVVFHDIHLFDRIYGIPDLAAKSEQIQQWLHRLGLAHKVQWCDDRFNNLDLAPGERKRLALIAALLEDKPILIFDEWVADQDPTYRRFFYETLLPELKTAGKTVIIVSHDDAYFAGADRIITLKEGQIAPLESFRDPR